MRQLGLALRIGVELVEFDTFIRRACGCSAFVQEGRLTLSKVPGEKNVADLGTKHLDGKRLWMLMAMMGLKSAAGRSELSLRAAGEVMA